MKTFTLTHLSKVHLLLLCLFVAAKASINAQVPNSVQNVPSPQTYSEQSDQLLRFVDKSPINTGILYDRAFPLADVESFNGQLDAGTSHSEHFFQTYYEFYSSNYNNSGRLSPQQLRASVDEYANSNYYPIGLMCMKYNVIDDNAVNDNLLQYDSGSNALYDVQGRPRSPYLERTTLVVAPLLHPVVRSVPRTLRTNNKKPFLTAYRSRA